MLFFVNCKLSGAKFRFAGLQATSHEQKLQTATETDHCDFGFSTLSGFANADSPDFIGISLRLGWGLLTPEGFTVNSPGIYAGVDANA